MLKMGMEMEIIRPLIINIAYNIHHHNLKRKKVITTHHRMMKWLRKDREGHHAFSRSIHPSLPSSVRQNDDRRDESQDDSLPVDMADASFYTYYRRDTESQIQSYIHRRRHSWPICDNPNKQRTPPPLHGIPNKSIILEEKKDGLPLGLGLGLTAEDMAKLEEDSDDNLEKKKKSKDNQNDDEDEIKEELERFRIEDYELLAPSLIKVFFFFFLFFCICDVMNLCDERYWRHFWIWRRDRRSVRV